MHKPRLSFWQIWNMSFGFFGIQFGWGLQMANMSSIYQYLGAKESDIAFLWLAAPLTGLLIQPLVGYFSDRTWCGLGRRRPYFLVGAILSSLALIAMPNSGTLWMAAGLLWILDASVNITMEPFRAFVGDMLPKEQRKSGFAMQSLLIGLGAVLSSALPWILTNWFGVKSEGGAGKIPHTVQLAFYIGAAVFFVAVIYTIVTTKEYPPEDMSKFLAERNTPPPPIDESGVLVGKTNLIAGLIFLLAALGASYWHQMLTSTNLAAWNWAWISYLSIGGALLIGSGLGLSQRQHWGRVLAISFVVASVVFIVSVNFLSFQNETRFAAQTILPIAAYSLVVLAVTNQPTREIFLGIGSMPRTMRQLAVVQFFTWFALFCMWIYFIPAVATKMFGGTPGSPEFQRGSEWGGVCFSIYNGTAFGFAFVLLALVQRFSARTIHRFCLFAGGAGLALATTFAQPNLLIFSMILVGIAWASILSMPYAMLANAIPAQKMGFYMGVFNFFIVIPQILASLGLGLMMKHLLGDNPMNAVLLGGLSMIVAGFCVSLVSKDVDQTDERPA